MNALIKPAGGKHAIEVMAIGIEWETQLDADGLQKLDAIYKGSPTISNFLPDVAPVRSLVFQFGATASAAPQDQSSGFDARRVNQDGNIIWSLSVRPDFLACNCMEYDRWATVKPRAMALLTPLLDAALNCGNKIKAIGLQYQDAFNINGSIDSELVRTLFRENSKLLPLHLFGIPSLWHSHQGWFSASPTNRRVLNNLNLDVLEQNSNHIVKINGQHRVFAVSPNGKNSMPIGPQDVEHILDFLHAKNKDVLRDILSESVLKQIGFELVEQK